MKTTVILDKNKKTEQQLPRFMLDFLN